MTIDEACRAVILSRGDAIVNATMGAMGALDRLDVGQPRLSCVPLMGRFETPQLSSFRDRERRAIRRHE